MLVSVTRTGNENDIIEAFARHHVRLFDRLLIIDDNSTDGTLAILEKLIDEGLPIDLYRASEVDWPQPDFVTRLMHIAFGELAADWVAPLDADEFVELPSGAHLTDFLPSNSQYLLQLRWNNFAWQQKLADKTGNPVERLRMRMAPRMESFKSMVPRSVFVRDPQARVGNGNHEVYCNGQSVQLVHRDAVALCHFPIRSVDQFVSKCVINYLRYLETPTGPATAGFQYREPVELIKNGAPGLMRLMERASQYYAVQAGGKIDAPPVYRPLRYLGGSLKYSSARAGALPNIVRHAEALAAKIAAMAAG